MHPEPPFSCTSYRIATDFRNTGPTDDRALIPCEYLSPRVCRQNDEIPDDLPPHPCREEQLGDGVTIRRLIEGDEIDPSVVMRWSKYVNEYASEVTPPPELPTRLEDSTVEQVENTDVSDCSTDEIVALLGWHFWHESGERELFRDDEPEERS